MSGNWEEKQSNWSVFLLFVVGIENLIDVSEMFFSTEIILMFHYLSEWKVFRYTTGGDSLLYFYG